MPQRAQNVKPTARPRCAMPAALLLSAKAMSLRTRSTMSMRAASYEPGKLSTLMS